jgi:hypothetical protein
MASMSNVLLYDALNLAIASGDTIKVAFYNSSSTIDRTTAAYTATNEVTQAGASPAINAGGLTVSGRTLSASDGSANPAGVDFSDVGPVTPAGSAFVFRKVMLYNSTRSNRALMTHDYGADQTWNVGTAYTLTIPGSGTYLLTLTGA